jgi:hypothetical protein
MTIPFTILFVTEYMEYPITTPNNINPRFINGAGLGHNIAYTT